MIEMKPEEAARRFMADGGAKTLAMRALLRRARAFIQEDRDATFDSFQVNGVIDETDALDFAAAERVRDCDAWIAACDEALS